MALKDLQKDLYRPEEVAREREHTAYDPEVARTASSTLGEESVWRARERESLDKGYRRPLLRITIVFAVVILGLFAVWTYFTVKSGLYAVDRVIVTVNGPAEVVGGTTVRYTIRYENNNATVLQGAKLVIEHAPQMRLSGPETLRDEGAERSVMDLGDLAPRASADIPLSVRVDGINTTALFINARLQYVPASTGADDERAARLGVQLVSAPVTVAVSSQPTVSRGGIVEYVVDYANASGVDQEGIVLAAVFPQGFAMKSADPFPTSGDTMWAIGKVPAGSAGTVRIRGTLEGSTDETKIATFTVGTGGNDGVTAVYAQATALARISRAPLMIVQQVNGSYAYNVLMGETLRYTLRYQNTSDLGMRDVVIRMRFDDRFLDFEHLQSAVGGALDAKTRSIVWRAADIPGLAILSPGQGGEINFTIPVRGQIVPQSEIDKNITFTTVAEIDSPDVPTPIGEDKTVSSNTMTLKLTSPVYFRTEGFYDDFTVKNTGPIPPLVNQTTTFTIRWSLFNGTNDLADTQVETFLPTSVKWTGYTLPESETIQFNERTGKIVWRIGDVAQGTGFFRKPREVRFQVAITPTIDQVDRPAPLLKEGTFVARDLFTGQIIRLTTPEKTTLLTEDPSIKDSNVRR